jgi:hypothetical protein
VEDARRSYTLLTWIHETRPAQTRLGPAAAGKVRRDRRFLLASGVTFRSDVPRTRPLSRVGGCHGGRQFARRHGAVRGAQIAAESVLTMSLGVKSQRRSEHPDLFGSQSVRMVGCPCRALGEGGNRRAERSARA